MIKSNDCQTVKNKIIKYFYLFRFIYCHTTHSDTCYYKNTRKSPHKTIGTLTKVFYTSCPNLVILAWTGDELSRGQSWWRTSGGTHTQTDAGNDNTRRPKLASGKKLEILDPSWFQLWLIIITGKLHQNSCQTFLEKVHGKTFMGISLKNAYGNSSLKLSYKSSWKNKHVGKMHRKSPSIYFMAKFMDKSVAKIRAQFIGKCM